MRIALAAALLLATGCATVPPLRPADPAQAVANEPSAATSVVSGVRVVVRPGAWNGYRGDLDTYFTPVEVAIQNGSGRAIQVRPAAFSLLTPNGFHYEALSPEDVRHALGPWRGSDEGLAYSFYAAYPVGSPFHPWFGPSPGWWGWGFGPQPWWGAVPYGARYAVPSAALAKGTLENGGNAAVLLLFPVPQNDLKALELDASFSDPSGGRVAELRVPFVREGQQPLPRPLPPTAAPPAAPPPQPGSAPAEPPPWETTPPGRPPPPPPVDTPVGPPVEPPTPPASPAR